MSESTAASWKGNPADVLDPWQIAAFALRSNDLEFVKFCMDLVVAPMRHGGDMVEASEELILPKLSSILMERININRN